MVMLILEVFEVINLVFWIPLISKICMTTSTSDIDVSSSVSPFNSELALPKGEKVSLFEKFSLY